MTDKDKYEILNKQLLKQYDYIDKLPKKLYKYREFNEYNYDSLINNYIYLSKASKLDDETECDTIFDPHKYFDLIEGALVKEVINIILLALKDAMNEDDYLIVKSVFDNYLIKRGKLSNSAMLDFFMEFQNLVPNVYFDPFINMFTEIPEKMQSEEYKEKIETFLKMGIEAKEEVGICSLADDPNNTDMWIKYASNSTGYCVEYDITDYEYIHLLAPVIYTDNREKDLIEQTLKSLVNHLIYCISQGNIKKDISHYYRMFLTKNEVNHWQSEWRFIGNGNEKLKAPKITKIILGKDVSIENETKLIEYCKQNNITITKVI